MPRHKKVVFKFRLARRAQRVLSRATTASKNETSRGQLSFPDFETRVHPFAAIGLVPLMEQISYIVRPSAGLVTPPRKSKQFLETLLSIPNGIFCNSLLNL